MDDDSILDFIFGAAGNLPASQNPTTEGNINPSMEGIMSLLDVSETPTATKGPGGGKDDQIPAVIQDEEGNPVQPAALSPGEFVVKADIVSFLGDGDTDSGAKLLDTLQGNEQAAMEVKEVLRKHAGFKPAE